MPNEVSRRRFVNKGVATVGAVLVYAFVPAEARPAGGARRAGPSQESVMPHVSIKMFPGRSEEQKRRLAEAIVEDVVKYAECGIDSVSVAIEEVAASEWKQKVFQPEILAKPDKLYKKPGYSM